MINRKAQSETAVIIGILSFQAFIIVCLGFINISATTEGIGGDVSIVGIPLFNWGTSLISNIALLGWANLIIFAPLIAGLVYIIARLIRGGG
jgi:hypothetical protein